MAILISHSAEETFRIAEEYAKTLKAGDVVRLDGEMGAGKTVFAKGVAKGLGIREEVTSPTYAYMNDYGGVLYHYDCYRIDAEKAEALGLSDYFYAKGVCLVEWAENIEELLPLETKRVFIRKLSETQREITL
ncbi:MAG: tRNA (adenosine(37)-N6)-threonylcarbamoyltransferase complex ATPase subunit type 1 TsaE [Clostridia bacterium]|nr:tRNA (adenosine(37)-N6)-threonylcarbamoyltransferase complex ATPase subunit type 1 TsaE [Clostridia bacterium]